MMTNDDLEKAQILKAEGNKHFTLGNYVAAESLYSKASVCTQWLCYAGVHAYHQPSPGSLGPSQSAAIS